jgi:hypothetical protein
MVSPLSLQNKNSSPSVSSVLDLTPDTDSVDATIEVSSRFAADFDSALNNSFESDLGDSGDGSVSLESVISTIQ